MQTLATIFGWMVAAFMGAAGLIILYKMAFDKIDLQKLISEENGDASMSRFQLLIFTFVIVMSLFLIIVSQTPPAFPSSIPADILALLGISGGSYLVSKGIQSSKEINNAKIQAQQTPPPTAGGAAPAADTGGDQPAMG
jgi:uncharacterized BrkB/YihY/UPF0761 family membrane protein